MGVMPAKIALAAGALLVTARVDMHTLSARLDPATSVSQVAPELARKLGVDPSTGHVATLPHKHVIGLGNEEFPFRQVAVNDTDGRTLVIGADLLKEMTLELDFRANRLRVVEQGALRRVTKHMVAVPATISADGCMSMTGITMDGAQIKVALVGGVAQPSGKSEKLTLGVLPFEAYRTGARSCPANEMVIDWEAFAGRTIVLDLQSGKVWMPAA
jgi:hypothetical protein